MRVFLLALLPALARAAQPIAITPSETDPRIRSFDSPHLAWLPDGAPRRELLVFLPGTGGTPEKTLFHPFATMASELGYHVVALMYPDNLASQKNCAESADPNASLDFRNAILRGGRIGPHRTIASPDSIESRLESCLHFLDAKQPGRGWGEFLTPGGGIRWRKIAVAGHSQGGGHAYMIGKNHEVARVLMFGSPKDYSFHFDAPARGFDANTRTPLRRFFAYNHVRDNGNGCTHEQQMKILRQITPIELGTADADRGPASYGHARVLTTNVDLGASTRFHSSVLNGSLPGNPPLWKYLLTETVE
ncbi:MAG TPA: hypothetical protein VMQ61_12870 [Thermoanaerobaculia bacterium]|nr:hypothetical protein [Thermoanaerobaculia bacterium]